MWSKEIRRSASGPEGSYKLHVYGGQDPHQAIGVKMIFLLRKMISLVIIERGTKIRNNHRTFMSVGFPSFLVLVSDSTQPAVRQLRHRLDLSPPLPLSATYSYLLQRSGSDRVGSLFLLISFLHLLALKQPFSQCLKNTWNTWNVNSRMQLFL